VDDTCRFKNHVILTESVVRNEIPKLVREGLSRAEIAEKLGCRENTLQVRCSKMGVSLNRGCNTKRYSKLEVERLKLTGKAKDALRDKAREKGYSQVRLASKLLEIIATDNLWDAVLDDKCSNE
jgi:uncharacterized protein YjcR